MEENYFKAFFKNSPAAYAIHRIIMDEQGIPYDYEILEINKAYENVMCVKASNVIGKRISEIYQLFNRQYTDKLHKIIQNSIMNNKVTKMDAQYSLINKWLRFKIFPMDKHYFACIIYDVTKEYMREKEIEGFLNFNLDILCVSDLNFNIYRVNKKFEDVLGYKIKELEGKYLLDLVHEDDLPSTLTKIKKLEEQKSVRDYVNRYRCKDGSYRYLAWHCESYGKYIYSSGKDITEEHKENTELLIKKQMNLLSNIIDNIEVGFVRYFYPELKITDINSKAYNDLKKINPDIGDLPSVIGKNVLNLFNLNKSEEAKFKINIQDIADKKVNSNFNYKKFDFAGDERFIKLIHQPLLEVNNKITEVVDIAVDITEEIKSKNEMAETIKIQEELLANVSHELKTPLNVIFSENQLMKLYLKDNSFKANREKIFKGVNIINQNCYRLTKLINNIVDLSKIKSGFFKLNMSNENIVQVTEDIVQSVSEYIKEKGLRIIFDTNTEEKIIACDPEKIERIILNLISNAIKFSNSGGSIFVNILDKGDIIEIAVEDTGVGIEKKYLNNIFGRFQQIDKSLSRNAEGSGIGLSLVKSIIKMHGGNISVESEVGKGSIFKIELPVRTIRNPKVIKETRQMNNRIQMINVEFSDIYSLD